LSDEIGAAPKALCGLARGITERVERADKLLAVEYDPFAVVMLLKLGLSRLVSTNLSFKGHVFSLRRLNNYELRPADQGLSIPLEPIVRTLDTFAPNPRRRINDDLYEWQIALGQARSQSLR